MASSSFFSGIETAGKRRKVSESSRVYDVFINHRGPDVKLTLASQLYNCLKKLGIEVFLDSEEKELGNSFPSTIETAIRSAKVHIAIFSKTYADSPWCLAELVLMLESNAKIIPVFYQVKPSDLRHIEKGVYAGAFKRYEEKGRYLEKLSQWKEALQSLSFVAGEEFDSFSDCKPILVAVQAELKRKTLLHVAEYPVGLNNMVVDVDELVQDFERQCGLKKGEDQVKMVGIFGMGGLGKTTLAKELFNRKMVESYSKACFLFDVREASATNFHSLQLKLLYELFGKEHRSFASAEEQTNYLRECIQRSSNLNFLIVLDDIDHVQQLNSLLVKDILNKSANTLIMVTTRDVGVLISAEISVGYNLKEMNRNYGMELFCWHAFGQPHPLCGYEALVDDFLDVCGGLPLSLEVLGRHVRGRPLGYWKLELLKAGKMLHGDVKKRLKISFDALDDEQKQIFMDIACFFLGKSISIAERVWEASGWNAKHALETLKDKCLVEEIWHGDLLLRMHNHLRDLGREMALELSHPPRLWRPQDLKSLESKGLKYILTRTNIRCFHSFHDESLDFQVTFFLGQSDNFGEPSAALLYLVLEGDITELSSIPSWIPLQNLHHLEIKDGLFETLWDNNIQAPSRLKELVIFSTEFEEFPDFSGMSESSENVFFESLEKLQISRDNYVSRIFISGSHCPILESITLEEMQNLKEVNLRRVKTLKSLSIIDCEKLKRLKGTSYLTNLVLLEIRDCPEIKELGVVRLSCLERILIRYCKHLKRILGIPNLGKLVQLEIEGCRKLEFDHLCLSGISCLRRMTFDRQVKVKYFKLDDCQNLKTIQFGCKELVELTIRGCPELETLPLFQGPSCLERITIDGCEKLECLELIGCQNLKSVSGKIDITQLHIVDCRELGKVQ